MSPRSFNLLLILALGAVAVSARAEETNLFSQPDDGTKDKADSLNKGSQHQLDAGNYNAPHRAFKNYSPSLPLPRPIFFGNLDAATKEALDRRNNWALLTPEQIMGVQTPEDVLGVEKTDSDKNLPVEEQFLLRESRPAANAATNGSTGALSWRDASNPFKQNQADQDGSSFFSSGAFSQPDGGLSSDSTRYFKQFLKANNADGLKNNGQKQATTWSSAFARPAQPKPTPAQLADMERFRAMLGPVSAPDKNTDRTPTVRTSFSSPPATDAGSYFQPQPIFNSIGHSVPPVPIVENNIARPVGLQPLPGITESEKPGSKTRPVWQAQLPPWMIDGPQLHNPNRNF